MPALAAPAIQASFNSSSRPALAAIVTYLFPRCAGVVNLPVFDSNGVSQSRTSVPLAQAGKAKLEHGY
jgi:hypothetical protein